MGERLSCKECSPVAEDGRRLWSPDLMNLWLGLLRNKSVACFEAFRIDVLNFA